MARLTVQAAIIGFGRLLTMAVAAGTMMVLARIMPDKESYGAIMLLIMLYVVLSQVFAVGLPQAVYYFLPRYSAGEQRGFITQIMLLLIASGLVLGGMLYFGADVLGKLLGSHRLTELLHIFALYPAFMLPTLAVEGILLSHNRPMQVVFFNVAIRIGMFASLIIPTLLHWSLVSTVQVWVIEAAVMCGVALVLVFATVRRVDAVWHADMLREVYKFSLPLAGLTLISLCSSYMDRFLVSHFFGTAVFGIYANATMEIPTVTMVTNATAVVLLAEFSRLTAVGAEDQVVVTWRDAIRKTAIMTYASFGFLVYWGHETIRLIYSDRFAESGNLFSIFVWSIPLVIFALRPLYVSRNATHVLLYLAILELVLALASLLFWGQIFGLAGYIFGGVFAGYLATIPWVHIYVRKLTNIGWKAFMPWKELGLTLLVALSAGGVTRLVGNSLPFHAPLILEYGGALLIYLLLYILGLHVTRLLGYVLPQKTLHWWKASVLKEEAL